MRRFTKKENEFLEISYDDFHRGYSITAREFNSIFNPERPISPKEVIKYWKDLGLGVAETGGYRNGLSKESFLCLYHKYNGNISLMSKESGLEHKALVQKCYSFKLPFCNNHHKPRKIKVYNCMQRARSALIPSKRKMPRD